MTEFTSIEARQEAIDELQGWHDLAPTIDAISKEFVFKNFNAAFAFMTSVAMKAEKMDHHPDWNNSYNTVQVTLTTHTSKQVTSLDIKLAKFMDMITA